MSVVTIRLDLANSVFQVHGVDAAGRAVLRRRPSRGEPPALFAKQPPCLIGMEACSSAHHWARLIAPEPYVKRNKTDAEAVRGRWPAERALRADQDARAAGHPGAAPGQGAAGAAAHGGG